MRIRSGVSGRNYTDPNRDRKPKPNPVYSARPENRLTAAGFPVGETVRGNRKFGDRISELGRIIPGGYRPVEIRGDRGDRFEYYPGTAPSDRGPVRGTGWIFAR